MKLDRIIPINIRTQLLSTSRCKQLRIINHNLPRKISRGWIYQGDYNKLLVVQEIPHSNTSFKKSYTIVISINIILKWQDQYMELPHH